jgi:hypothetical protein
MQRKLASPSGGCPAAISNHEISLTESRDEIWKISRLARPVKKNNLVGPGIKSESATQPEPTKKKGAQIRKESGVHRWLL